MFSGPLVYTLTLTEFAVKNFVLLGVWLEPTLRNILWEVFVSYLVAYIHS